MLNFFNERAARRSHSTSRFGCSFVCLFVCLFVGLSPLAHEQLQSAITMASVNRIDSIFFVWLRVCLLFVGDNMPRAPRARAVFWRHVPKLDLRNFSNFKVKLLWLPNSESAQIFFCGTVCVLGATRILWPTCAMCTCTCHFMKAHAKTSSEELLAAFLTF